MATVAAAGCGSVEPWVKPYERQNFADPIMAADRNPVATSYLNHVFEAARALAVRSAATAAAAAAIEDTMPRHHILAIALLCLACGSPAGAAVLPTTAPTCCTTATRAAE